MQKLKFIYQNWNRSYYELQSVKDTLWRHNNFYKNKMPKKTTARTHQNSRRLGKICLQCQ